MARRVPERQQMASALEREKVVVVAADLGCRRHQADDLDAVERDLALRQHRALNGPCKLELGRLSPVLGLARFGEALLVLALALARPLAVERGADTRLEQHRVERFREVVVRAELDAARDALGLAERGEHDDPNLAHPLVGLDPAKHLVTVHLGHHDVEQDEVESTGLEQLERLGAARGRHDEVPLALEVSREHVAVELDVVDDEQHARPRPVRGEAGAARDVGGPGGMRGVRVGGRLACDEFVQPPARRADSFHVRLGLGRERSGGAGGERVRAREQVDGGARERVPDVAREPLGRRREARRVERRGAQVGVDAREHRGALRADGGNTVAEPLMFGVLEVLDQHLAVAENGVERCAKVVPRFCEE